MSFVRFSLVLVLPFALVACVEETRLPGDPSTVDEDEGLSMEDQGGYCGYETTPLTLEEADAFGLPVRSVLAAADFEQATTLSWDLTGEQTALTLAITPDEADIALHLGEYVPPANGTEPAPLDCPSYADFGATLRFVTADGRLDETLAVRITATAEGVGRLDHVVDAATLTGTGPLFEEVPSEWDSVELSFAANVSAGASHGELAVSAFREDAPLSDDPDEPVTATVFHNDVARWPAAAE